MSIRITFEIVITALVVVVATWVYMVWYGDLVATHTGYYAALYVVPLVAGVSIGTIIWHILRILVKEPSKLWLFVSVGAISALVLPLWYLWITSQPH